MAGGERGNERHRAAQNRDRIVELRDQGLTFRDIAAELGVSHQRVWEQYQRAMRDRPVVAAHAERLEARREEQLRRIDMEREVLDDIVAKRHVTISNGHVVSEITGHDDDGKPIYGDPYEDDAPTMAAIDRLGKLDDQEAKLLGMYPKTEIAQSVTWRHEIVGVDIKDIL